MTLRNSVPILVLVHLSVPGRPNTVSILGLHVQPTLFFYSEYLQDVDTSNHEQPSIQNFLDIILVSDLSSRRGKPQVKK